MKNLIEQAQKLVDKGIIDERDIQPISIHADELGEPEIKTTEDGVVVTWFSQDGDEVGEMEYTEEEIDRLILKDK